MKKWLLSVLAFASITTNTTAQSPYTLKTGREAALLGAGAAFYGAAYAFNKTLDPLTPAQISQLNPASVPRFDRSATTKYSVGADKLSDVTLSVGISSSCAIMGVSANTFYRQNAVPTPTRYTFFTRELYTVGVMYAETMLLTNGLKSTVKNAVERTRPYAYNPVAPLADKLDKDTQRSFYSGHAANAFATAVFAAEVFRHYNPNSKAKPWVWLGSLGLASGTAYLRYEAGQHFPTDLLAGAAIGSLAGWGIPKLHERRGGTSAANVRFLTVTPWSNGLASGVYLRWSLSSPSFVTD